jgi:hypothetical protein
VTPYGNQCVCPHYSKVKRGYVVLPRRVMSGTGFRFGSTHLPGLEGPGGKILSEADPRVGGVAVCAI